MIEINVSIIIVTYKTKEITCNCVRSILDSEIQYSYEIIVVDNYSCDGTVEELRTRFPEIQVIACTENLGFSKGNNIGIKQAKGDYLLLLNSDTIVLNDSIENLLTTAILKKL